MEFERLAATGSFASWVAHQVRNPLAVIRAQAQLLLAEPAPDAARIEASCTSIVEQAESVGNVFALIMSLVQPLHLERQVVELERVVAGTVAALAALEGGAITFELDGVFAPVIGHAGLLGEALKNLVANAVECLAPGPGVVRLEGRTEGQWVYLTVADNGPGIPPGVVERSFELGYTTKPHGTGLGLPIVRAIAEAHGGRVEMMSRHGGPGAGTRVTMVLPRAGTP
jgi:signal transduction histidine kinase